jgi:hypothetical protein
MKLELVFLVALPMFGQGVAGMSASFSTGPDGAMRGTATFHMAPFLPPPVLNAPYSGEEVTEQSQVLADGTRITRPNLGPQQKVWRDSQGRVRTERPMGPRRDNNDPPVIVQISDPPAGYVYVLDTVNHVAHRVRVDARSGGAAGMSNPAAPPSSGVPGGAVGMTTMMAAPPPPAGVRQGGGVAASAGAAGGGMGFGGGSAGGTMTANAQRPQPTVEQLGTKMIDGVLVTGTRMTTIIPEGAQGNDRPMTTTSETWVSKELQLPILTVNNSPMSGTMTRKYANFSTAEPAPSLFMVPAGYSIVEEKESFTIRWGN